jgi:hypothetical protein
MSQGMFSVVSEAVTALPYQNTPVSGALIVAQSATTGQVSHSCVGGASSVATASPTPIRERVNQRESKSA